MTKEHELQSLIDQRDVLDTELERINAAIASLEATMTPEERHAAMMRRFSKTFAYLKDH